MAKEKDLRQAYKTIEEEHFPNSVTISFNFKNGSQELLYEKKTWSIPDPKTGEPREDGLRYGENPGQPAALYKLTNGNLVFGDVHTIQPGRYLASNAKLLRSGKHPGKINITDADNALNILRYFTDQPVVAIMKHNNPCGVAIGESILDAYQKANLADRVAAFGGTIALNRPVNKETAEAITENYSEVVVAPGYEEGVMSIFAKRSNLRIMEIKKMEKLKDWVGEKVVDFKSLIDGGLIVQTSYVPKAITLDDIKALPLGYFTKKNGTKYKIQRAPTEQEYRDMWFGWLVESGITSNSVIYVKDGVTVGIGTGEQDRVGVAEIAKDKAYWKRADEICWKTCKKPFNTVKDSLKKTKDPEEKKELGDIILGIKRELGKTKGGLKGAVTVSDAFFPFRDGVDVGLNEGITAIIQPGGSDRDFESIEACNEADATMIYTEQRSFKH
ncbi:MAG: IMP cyclohydrolase [Candidatus Woesearchaeota archaeon]|jgi:phosphoribosylaminoimidazolecarboxamide formyltransferase/IMP cyclohydrolase|nr:IMP cyclohydrolase [Candidatus Woesearchaeota archaeon]MDP7610469.1 IMP cyclohydrolase [Candidatus Woesearchaeota archaeon]|tara:strand:- start:4168 stop:5496 length:1329 start_codon:yes stop_codon:yes gene_type:complete